jgi:hypothetical protein
MNRTVGVCVLSMTLLIGGCATQPKVVDLTSWPPEAEPILTFAIRTRNDCRTDCVAHFEGKQPQLNDCLAYCDCAYEQGALENPTIGKVVGCLVKWRFKLQQ